MYIISDNIVNAAFWPQEVKSVNLWFGMNLVHEVAGQLSLGDPVEVISRRDSQAW